MKLKRAETIITSFVSADFNIKLTEFFISVIKNPTNAIKANTPLSTPISRKMLYALKASKPVSYKDHIFL